MRQRGNWRKGERNRRGIRGESEGRRGKGRRKRK